MKKMENEKCYSVSDLREMFSGISDPKEMAVLLHILLWDESVTIAEVGGFFGHIRKAELHSILNSLEDREKLFITMKVL
jgi:hypothetical protein